MIGFLNMLVQLILEDGEFQELWDYFVIEGSFGLLRPLIVIMIALRFNLFELSNEHIRERVRILALLIITVWASGLFEIVQAFVPMPQLLSAALIGVALAFAIGWEDRVFEGLMDDSISRQVPEFTLRGWDSVQTDHADRCWRPVFGVPWFCRYWRGGLSDQPVDSSLARP